MSDPDDQPIVHTISATDGHINRILVIAYGPTGSALNQEMVRKVATHVRE